MHKCINLLSIYSRHFTMLALPPNIEFLSLSVNIKWVSMPCGSGTHIEKTWLPTMQIDMGLKDQFLMGHREGPLFSR